MTTPPFAFATAMVIATLVAFSTAGQDDAPANLPETVQPVPSSETRSRPAGWGSRSWRDQHEDGRRFLQESTHPGGADLVLLGDSITQSFGGEGRRTGQPGRTALRRALPGLVVANQGISGDRTQHLLWRLRHDALAQRNPTWIAVMIGTNNLPHDQPPAIAAGIKEVVAEIQRISPTSIILLHAVPPRGTSPEDPMRARATETNRIARSLADGKQVRWVDPWRVLLEDDGAPRSGFLAGDGVHLGPQGYEAWAKTLQHQVSRPPRPAQPTDAPSTD